MNLLVILGVLLAAFYLWLSGRYKRLWESIAPGQGAVQAKVAVIIAFRNEEEKLPRLLDSIEKMDWPLDLEWIFVDDHSNDQSAALIKDRAIQGSRLLSLEDTKGKKAAIQFAWEQSDAEIFLHTDADCVLPSTWLSSMLAPFADTQVGFVSGPVTYQKEENFLHRFLLLDFAGLNVAGAAHIQWKRPLMCNGANLAYRSKLNKELSHHYASGDDVFLMQNIEKTGAKLVFQKDKAAMVKTDGPEDWPSFLQQRIRWAGKNTGYTDKSNTAIMFAIWLVNLYILLFVFFPGPLRLTACFALLCKTYADIRLFYSFKDFYGIREFIAELILGQVYHIPYMALTPIFSKIVPYKWKGRRIRQ